MINSSEAIENLKQSIEKIQEQDFPYMEVGTGNQEIEDYQDCLAQDDPEDIYLGLLDCLSDHQGIVEQNTYVDYIN